MANIKPAVRKTTITYVNGAAHYKHELLPADDPSLPPPGEVRIDYGTPPSSSNVDPAKPVALVAPGHEAIGCTNVDPGDCSTNSRFAATEHAIEAPTRAGNSIPLTQALVPSSSTPKQEKRQEVTMANYGESDNDYYDEDEAEDDDRPSPITEETLRAIDKMSPPELENVIDNVDEHERWQDLREEAKLRVGQWLGAIKKADAAPRCEFIKPNGQQCGSPHEKPDSLLLP